jgi:acyl-CoA synthetase (AMP-forming)/AMP-acid ligase II
VRRIGPSPTPAGRLGRRRRGGAGRVPLTHGGLEDLAGRPASASRAAGLRAGDRVALPPYGPELIAGYLHARAAQAAHRPGRLEREPAEVESVLARSPGPLDIAVVREHLPARLAAYQRPERLEVLPRLPTTPVGKPDRTALAELARRRAHRR